MGRVCYAFYALARLHIQGIRRRRSLLEQKSEMEIPKTGTGPLLCPQSGDTVVLLQKDPFYSLEVWDITAKELKAKCNLPKRIHSIMPNGFEMSNTGKFVCIIYDLFSLVYVLRIDAGDSIDTGICLFHIFRYELPARFMYDAYDDKHSATDTRCLVAFSPTDEYMATLRIDRGGHRGRTVKLQYTSTKVSECGDPLVETVPEPAVQTNMKWRTFQSPTEWVSLLDFGINPDPLRIIVPPGVSKSKGFVLRAERPLQTRFLPIPDRAYSLQRLLFSKCGRFLVEAVSRVQPGTQHKVSLRYWDIVSGQLYCNFSSVENSGLLELQLSRDGKCAVIFLGESACDWRGNCCIDGWNIYYLESKEQVHIEQSPCSRAKQFESHFSLSYDGELIALAADFDASKREYDILIYEAGTAEIAKEMRCRAPQWPELNFISPLPALPGGGRGCTHLTGICGDMSLTSFSLEHCRVACTHFRSDQD